MNKLLRKVYSIDTRAGDALRYIITRAKCDRSFAYRITSGDIDFWEIGSYIPLVGAFSWSAVNDELYSNCKIDWAGISITIRFHEEKSSFNKNSVFYKGGSYGNQRYNIQNLR